MREFFFLSDENTVLQGRRISMDCRKKSWGFCMSRMELPGFYIVFYSFVAGGRVPIFVSISTLLES